MIPPSPTLYKSGLLPEVFCPSYQRKQEGARRDSVYRPLVGIFFVFWSVYIFDVLYKKKNTKKHCLTFISCSESTNIVSYVFFILLPFCFKGARMLLMSRAKILYMNLNALFVYTFL